VGLVQKRREAGDKSRAVEQAAAVLAGAVSKVKLNQRDPPEGFDADRLKAEVVAAMEGLTSQ